MVSANKKKTLIEAIEALLLMKKKVKDPEKWRAYRANLPGSDDDDLFTQAWVATKKALEGLECPRCDHLRTEEVAVLCDRGKRQMSDLLRDEFRPLKVFKSGVDYRRISDTRARVNPNTGKIGSTTRDVWVYRRDSVLPRWWDEYTEGVGKTRAEVAKKRWAASKKGRLEKEYDQTMARAEALKAELDSICAFIDRTTRSLDGVARDLQPFIVDPSGAIFDHAWLPVSTAEEIREQLASGAHITEMTLDQALRLDWTELAQWNVWRGVWDQCVENAACSLNQQHGSDVARRTRAPDVFRKVPIDKGRP
jgi:hypothetical protein